MWMKLSLGSFYEESNPDIWVCFCSTTSRGSSQVYSGCSIRCTWLLVRMNRHVVLLLHFDVGLFRRACPSKNEMQVHRHRIFIAFKVVFDARASNSRLDANTCGERFSPQLFGFTSIFLAKLHMQIQSNFTGSKGFGSASLQCSIHE